jgi:hypothetical protein
MRDFGGRDRWLPTPGLPRDGRQASRPLAVGDVLDVPGFEALLEPVYWLVLGVHGAEVALVAIDRGVAGEEDVWLPREMAANDAGMSGWTVRTALARVVAAATLAAAGAVVVGHLQAGLLDRLPRAGEIVGSLVAVGSRPRTAAVRRTSHERVLRAVADRLLPPSRSGLIRHPSP